MSNPHISDTKGRYDVGSLAARESRPGDGDPAAPSALTVLLVEDDVLIRMDAVDMLRGLGYQVLEAEYGPDALVQLRERSIDVLVTDVGLPGMSGTELAERARQLQPGIGLVFATGDTELESRKGRPRAAILCKPYDSASLGESVRRALAHP
ncbi:response regulator [Frateuria soli]|uniref:response regulator n=1 Tax=Frateuria soli TaxID=1542730 RepID=UPI001E300CAE|nr:response regulator [Frateuria soli]UGB39341.1 response regulator [Frateuria soli]